MHLLRRVRSLRILALLGIVGCRRQTAIAPVPVEQGYCWWTTRYVAIAPAWLLGRFENALTEVGFERVRKELTADSASVSATPSVTSVASRGLMLGFQAIIHPASDSLSCAWRGIPDAPRIKRPRGAVSCFRAHWYVYAAEGTATTDASRFATEAIGLCERVHGIALAGLDRLQAR
jgi:hypothetical protein